MGKFKVGDIVLVVFPFSDLSGHKLRPALVLARAEFGNLILAQITSKPYSSKTAIKLESDDFIKGGLPVISFIRPDKIFTAEQTIIAKRAGSLKQTVAKHVIGKVRSMFQVN